MGIKFRCPNGHKLNVKSFLAGKKGICPHCGTKVVIPDEVEQDEVDDAISENAAAVGGIALAVGAPPKSMADTVAFQPVVARSPTPSGMADVAIAAAPSVRSASVVTAAAPTIPMGTAIQPAPVQPAPFLPSQPLPGVPVGIVPTASVAMPMTAPLPAMPALSADPIAEAPNAVWYVRPPSGGQFGPARGDIMRKWLGEGRVSADSLVWRDGWADWKSAAIVFPQLVPGGAAAPAGELVIAAPTIAGPKNSAARSIRAKRKSSGFAVAMVVILGLISVILLGLLAYVVVGFSQA